jgi:single-stranded DNA-binding protein
MATYAEQWRKWRRVFVSIFASLFSLPPGEGIVNPVAGESMSINHVVLTGLCAEPGPKLTYNPASAKPECRLTLVVEDGKGEQVFSLYVPIFVYGNGAETAASEVDSGDLIAVDGCLGWKSTLKKDGTKLGLCVSTFGVEILGKADVSVEAAVDPELIPASEPTTEPPVKARRRSYPKTALRATGKHEATRVFTTGVL